MMKMMRQNKVAYAECRILGRALGLRPQTSWVCFRLWHKETSETNCLELLTLLLFLLSEILPYLVQLTRIWNQYMKWLIILLEFYCWCLSS